MINWGDWSQMPDYRQFMSQKGKSPIAQLARTFDPMTHVPGVNQVANPIHDAATAGIESGNRLLSPVVKAAHGLTDVITPGLKQVREQVPMMQNIHRFAETNPVDTAAIIVGSIFSGGALGGAAGGGAGSAGTGAATGAGSAGSSLGAVGGSTAGALQGGGMFSGIGSSAPGLIGSLKAGYAAAQPYLAGLKIASRLNSFAGPDTDMLGRRAQQNLLAERIRADQTNPEQQNNPFSMQNRRQQIIDALMQRNFFGRNY